MSTAVVLVGIPAGGVAVEAVDGDGGGGVLGAGPGPGVQAASSSAAPAAASHLLGSRVRAAIMVRAYARRPAPSTARESTRAGRGPPDH